MSICSSQFLNYQKNNKTIIYRMLDVANQVDWVRAVTSDLPVTVNPFKSAAGQEPSRVSSVCFSSTVLWTYGLRWPVWRSGAIATRSGWRRVPPTPSTTSWSGEPESCCHAFATTMPSSSCRRTTAFNRIKASDSDWSWSSWLTFILQGGFVWWHHSGDGVSVVHVLQRPVGWSQCGEWTRLYFITGKHSRDRDLI